MTSLSCDDLVVQVLDAGVPVLFLDTCLILDLVRAPIREQVGVHDVQAVHKLLKRAAQRPPAVTFVVDEQVKNEFLKNVDEVERQTKGELIKATERYTGILERMAELSPGNGVPTGIDLVSLGFPEKGRQLAEEIVELSSALEDHNDEVVKAYARVNFAKPPATQAKQSVKDCLIIESYLRLARELQSAGFSGNTVFATSNTKDYQQGHRSLHPDLRTEFDAVRLVYSPTWSAARHELDCESNQHREA